MTKRDAQTYLGAILLGLAAMMLYLTFYHLYLDHRFIDDIRTQIQNQQQQQRKP